MTNIEKIKNMTPKELSELLGDIIYVCAINDTCATCPLYGTQCFSGYGEIEKWLIKDNEDKNDSVEPLDENIGDDF